jgi:sterol desaturase/sphingolipid hydroxylase (fatty acid hydroxylase superfamily)
MIQSLLYEYLLVVHITVFSVVSISAVFTWWHLDFYKQTGKWNRMKLKQEYSMSCFGLITTATVDFVLTKFLFPPLPLLFDGDGLSQPPVWLLLGAVIHLLMADFGIFFVHWMFHRLSILRPYHISYHHKFVEPSIVGFAANHWFENVCLLLGMRACVFVWPMPIEWILFQNALSTFITMIGHANIDTPWYLQRAAESRWLLAGQAHLMHHHHVVYNFGLIFSLWDRLFGTYKHPDDLPPKYARGCVPPPLSIPLR